ncbi:hypothetical protein [Austwickia chelonae]|uniref:hypothetical protein n=1 Tax=Austwickia chelonae TaxID=100225 RepID=UPI000E275FD2|nr:hypothetical protein [Austwickia chelonae]
MHRIGKELRDLRATAAVLGILAIGVAVPTLSAAALGTPSDAVTTGQRDRLTVDATGTHVEWAAPEHWQRQEQVRRKYARYVDGERALSLTVISSVKDQQTAMERQVRSAAASGQNLRLTEQKISTANEFSGLSCEVTGGNGAGQGRCAMVGRDGFLIVITSTAPTDKEPLDITTLIDSLTVKKEKA